MSNELFFLISVRQYVSKKTGIDMLALTKSPGCASSCLLQYRSHILGNSIFLSAVMSQVMMVSMGMFGGLLLVRRVSGFTIKPGGTRIKCCAKFAILVIGP